MPRSTLDQLLASLYGQWLSLRLNGIEREQVEIGRVVIDSRDVQPGDVFWAIPGPRRDGANFAGDAFARGASGVVASSSAIHPPSGCWAATVVDSQQSLRQAARSSRRHFSGHVIGVTGSVGKTTTRQLINTVLGSRWSGTASPRNFNNDLGVPLSMLAWSSDQDYAVLELGASRVGDVARLTDLCSPQIGVITRVAEAHLGTFGSRESVANAKAELLDALPRDGLAVLNGDDSQIRRVAARSRAPIVWVGRGLDNDLIATGVRSTGGRLEFQVDGQRLSVPLWGRHYLTSVLPAVAIAREWDLPRGEMADALAAFQPPPMRCNVMQVRGACVIDDTYNASPTAMRAALELLREFDAPGRRIVVCGDMRELGSESSEWHRQLGDEVVTVCGANLLIACGDFADDVAVGAAQAGMPPEHVFSCASPEESAALVQRHLREGDVVLVKGSRAVGMERCLEALAWESLEFGAALQAA